MYYYQSISYCVNCFALCVLYGQRAIHPTALAAPCLGINRGSFTSVLDVDTCATRVSRPASPSTATTTMAKQSHILPTNFTKTTPPRNIRRNFVVILALLVVFQFYILSSSFPTLFRRTEQLPFYAERSLARCSSLRLSAGPTSDFQDRTESDRFVHGTKATLLHNARIWTGENNGTKIVHGDVLFDKGIIQDVGNLNLSALGYDVNDMIARGELNVLDVHGAWVTPGCVGFAFGPLLPWC